MNEWNIYIFKKIFFLILFKKHYKYYKHYKYSVLYNNYWNKIVNIPDIKKIYRRNARKKINKNKKAKKFE